LSRNKPIKAIHGPSANTFKTPRKMNKVRASPMMEWCKEQVQMWASRSPKNSSQSASPKDLFSGFVCIDLNAIAGGNMRVREHLKFDSL
jgi:hypothetical protein